MSPLFYAKWADRRNTNRSAEIERAARCNLFYGVLAASGLILFGRHAILLLYGREFLPAYPVLFFFAPAMVFNCSFTIFNSLLASDGRAATTARVLATTVLLVCGLTYMQVPVWGIYGAAVAVLCGNVFSTVMMAVSCRERYAIRLHKMILIQGDDFRYLLRAFKRG
jgi:O-antigen/teichoic acid export membrane protein